MTIKNGDLPAIPMWCEQIEQQLHGLTKREMFAMAAMQGLASESCRYGSPCDMAHDAVKLADALLAELERTK